jgi:hypothetical protein
VAGLQLSLVHALLSPQLIGVFTQPVAGLQLSLVQALLSPQLIGVFTQPVAGSQVSLVHALLSPQINGRTCGEFVVEVVTGPAPCVPVAET